MGILLAILNGIPFFLLRGGTLALVVLFLSTSPVSCTILAAIYDELSGKAAVSAESGLKGTI